MLQKLLQDSQSRSTPARYAATCVNQMLKKLAKCDRQILKTSKENRNRITGHRSTFHCITGHCINPKIVKMKPALKRIEEALNQLEQSKHTASVQQPSPTKNRPFSFEIFRTAPQSNSFLAELSAASTSRTSTAPQLPKFPTESKSDVLSDAQSDRANSLLETPAANTAPQSSHLNTDSDSDTRSDAQSDRDNSLLATQTDADDATKLEQVVHQIQDLYYEGPIVNAWLEYYPAPPEPSAEPLREISFERPMETQTVSFGDSGAQMSELSDASYLLCGIDESGRQWSCPCPLDQLPSISIAIARYHKLQQLLQQKHYLEIRLKEVSQEKAEG